MAAVHEPAALPLEERVAQSFARKVKISLRSAIGAYEKAAYGSHVTEALRDALGLVEFSLREVGGSVASSGPDGEAVAKLMAAGTVTTPCGGMTVAGLDCLPPADRFALLALLGLLPAPLG